MLTDACGVKDVALGCFEVSLSNAPVYSVYFICSIWPPLSILTPVLKSWTRLLLCSVWMPPTQHLTAFALGSDRASRSSCLEENADVGGLLLVDHF